MSQRRGSTGDGVRSGIAKSLVVILVAAGCAGEAPDTAPEAPSDAGLEGTRVDPDGWTIGTAQAPADVGALPPMPILQAIRPGTHDGFQRVTLDLGPSGVGIPGWRAEYIDRPLHQCGSGNQIFPVGDAWLEIRLEPAQAHTDEGAATLPGREIEVGGELLRRIYVTCDFEGVVTLVLAVDRPNEFRVFALADPRRIVVDIRR